MNRKFSRTGVAATATLLTLCSMMTSSGAATTSLADQPIFAATVPGNLVLDLSVEFPTAISVANIGNYTDSSSYLGYFDPVKCYTYVYTTSPEPGSTIVGSGSYFQATAFGTGTNSHFCGGTAWSGNFMNWASMQTIDPFRAVLTGGYRSVDTATQTILEKAWGANQGSAGGNFNYRGTTQLSPNNLPTYPTNLIPLLTPMTNWSILNTGIWGNGNTMLIAQGTGYTASTYQTNVYDMPSNVNLAAATPGQPYTTAVPNTALNVVTYRMYIRVLVCDTSQLGIAGLETNCVKYGSNYKPQGLMQSYANTIRYAAISYLNADGNYQPGGVLREPMGYIGPTYPTPLSATLTTNTKPEWSSTDGTMPVNPDPTTASGSGVAGSGVMNYLNKFGEYAASAANYTDIYMTDDDVSELYYAAVRYFENLGNVPAWLGNGNLTATNLDGFPAVVTWTDPILYSCQKNFILGIGDDHTHTDYNVGGAASGVANFLPYPYQQDPAQVSGDTFNKAATWTTEMEVLEGLPQVPWWYTGSSNATYYIAGLAYGTHVNDIRADLTGTQTISTYWLDVEEGGGPENLNPYYEATKYGGFTVPSGYTLSNTTPLTLSEWDTTGNTILMNGNNTQYQPDNYFLAGNANLMAAGLAKAFANISDAVSNYSAAYALSTPNITSTGNVSYASQYNSTNWTDTVTAQTFTFDSNGNPQTPSTVWVSSSTLQTQLGSGGWQSARRVATYSGTAGVPFEVANLTTAQLTALTPSSYSTNSSTNYLNYLRGDQSNEVGCTVSSTQASCGTNKSLRTRTLLLGDVVDASLAEVTTPLQTFSETNNPGYTAFTTQWTTTTPRPTMVYAAANDGMLHGFVGSSGVEQFAYVPSALFQGPTATPQVNGLAALGNPTFVHHYYVDATPIAYDIDLNRTGTNASGSGSPNWHTLLIGGLAKGGMSYYAIDVTNPAGMTSETAVAADVKWEFPNSNTDSATAASVGYSFGAPIVVKTAQYGWVVAFTSGYNSTSSVGYLYLVNPATGALLQKIATPSASSGLTQASAYVQDYTDYTADSIYVGDLNGQLWRFNLTATSGTYPTATLLATLTDASGNPQPVTTAPLIEIHPTTRERYVMVGTGEFLSVSDVTTTAQQSFYVIIDGTAGSFNAVSTPITRSVLSQATATGLVTGLLSTPVVKGWYIDLGNDPTSGYAWRVDIKPAAYNGTVSFAAFLPSGNACALSGLGEIYSVNYATATSVLTSQPTGYYAVPAAVVNLNYIGLSSTSSSSTNAELIAGLANGTVIKIPETLNATTSTRLLNWRELPSVQ
jgi:type IV pilus assembly protein PilY1